MARALECPACGHRHRLDAIPSADSFRCEQCGQVLKAPTTVSSDPAAPTPPARGARPPVRNGDSTAGGAAAPAAGAVGAAGAAGAQPVAGAPPRRANAPVADGPTRAAPVRSAAAVSATVAATGTTATGPAETAATAASPRDRRSTAAAPAAAAASAPASTSASRAQVHWYWRLLAWVVAVPLGFLVTAWPAYQLGFVKKDDLLDIFVGTGLGRYLRLAIVTLVWALVTALLVQIFVEGGRARANRRRRAQATASRPA